MALQDGLGAGLVHRGGLEEGPRRQWQVAHRLEEVLLDSLSKRPPQEEHSVVGDLIPKLVVAGMLLAQLDLHKNCTGIQQGLDQPKGRTSA